ncbi:MAG: hypothetical protein CMK74_01080 [Pseudomonadales bacterium]|jgi:hypothetical protein|nr:hypothetical protein [Pseudomonadales bacterium]
MPDTPDVGPALPAVPQTWAALVKSPASVIFLLFFGSGVTIGGMSLSEWADAARAVPELVEEAKAGREIQEELLVEVRELRSDLRKVRVDSRATAGALLDEGDVKAAEDSIKAEESMAEEDPES